ncbi:DUF6199 family natural product biosynthesis protein [Neobacillus sp. DY30]|uniref:DUF6199 family natural product biosynthesis protein n=1 Tax=Neobacillus sp. DY30 TaxID=3047871 RepID=UPI0024C09234|nr:DUF6199 family natural product biosynthesis protein [Neobacillus sp. DY30]WHX98112.1 hypothetical protein QNH29_15690 [Neobacillus sp. DY30]
MFILGIVFIIIGVFFIIDPTFIGLISERWKSNDGTEPSDMYLWTTRFGGMILIVAGIGMVIVALL